MNKEVIKNESKNNGEYIDYETKIAALAQFIKATNCKVKED